MTTPLHTPAAPLAAPAALPSRRSLLRAPLVRVALGLTAILLAFLLSGRGGDLRGPVTNGFLLVLVGMAAWEAWRAARHPAATPRLRRGWQAVSFGTACYATSMACWTLGDLHVRTPRFLPDAALALYYVGVLVGLSALARDRRAARRAAEEEAGVDDAGRAPLSGDDVRFWLDMAAVLLAGGAVVWALILAPEMAGHGMPTTIARWVDAILGVLFPVASLGILFGTASVMLREGGAARARPALGGRAAPLCMAAGGLLAFVSDLGSSWLSAEQGYYHPGSWPDAVLALWALCWVAGAARVRAHAAGGGREDAAPTGGRAPRATYLPYAAIAVGYGTLIVDAAAQGAWTATTRGLLGIAVALTAVVVARQVLAVRDNARLLDLLAMREARVRAIFDQSPSGIVVARPDGTIVEANPAFARLVGWERDALRGQDAARLVPTEQRGPVRTAFRDLRQERAESRDGARAGGRRTAAFETPLTAQGGETVWAHLTLAAAHAAGEERVIGIALDVTERRRLESELVHQAFHDALTGLANRALFRDRVAHALARAQRDGVENVAVLFLDLDDFKSVNDGLGHEAGDRLLVTVAERLRRAMREGDTVARLGGDEFAVLVEDVHADDEVLAIAERVADALRAPVELGGRDVRAMGSVGVARARPGDGAEELLRNADMAMYQAKQAGKGRVALYAAEMHAAALDRLELEADLRRVLDVGVRATADVGHLHVMYQPLVDFGTGRVTGFEALARWTHPQRGAVSPAQFIPVAEETGLIVPLGAWVLGEACRTAAGWGAFMACADGRALGVSVNLSGRQLREPGLVEAVRAALAESGVAPARLTLEITESVLMHDVEQTLATLRALKALGVQLAIDDFGTGYSSLSHLQRFPVDVLKIDKAFVDGVARGGTEAALARTVIALGATLRLRTVAEGIEHGDQEAALRRLGCDVGQGYHYARPIAASEVPPLLAVRYTPEGVMAAVGS